MIPSEAFEWINDLNEKLKFDLDGIHAKLNEPRAEINNNDDEDVYTDVQAYQINENYLNCSQSESSNLFVGEIRKLSDFVCDTIGTNESLYITQKQFEGSLKRADIVTTSATRTNCFTKNYGRFMDGTGSILRVGTSTDLSLSVNKKSLRFLSPREISNLHCFPNDFGKFQNNFFQLFIKI